jgi:hypothetical protein
VQLTAFADDADDAAGPDVVDAQRAHIRRPSRRRIH